MPNNKVNGIETISLEDLFGTLKSVNYFETACNKCSKKSEIITEDISGKFLGNAYNNKQTFEREAVEISSDLKTICEWYGLDEGTKLLEEYAELCCNRNCDEGVKKAGEIKTYFRDKIMEIKAKKKESQDNM